MQKHPLDYDLLEKGDVIPQSVIEEILQVKPTSPLYSLKLQSLKEKIEQELFERGRPMTVITRKNELAILTDAEASQYNFTNYFNYISRASKRHAYLCSTVDPSALDSDQRAIHLRRVEVTSRVEQSMVQTVKRIAADPASPVRSLPKFMPVVKRFSC